mmetsp:Transcript_173884/g.422919  ORF Transcript_173884/g.422919 Transcript_173884/m.422919 type:complete len:247 (-) Transcript_173884:30-770(-)
MGRGEKPSFRSPQSAEDIRMGLSNQAEHCAAQHSRETLHSPVQLNTASDSLLQTPSAVGDAHWRFMLIAIALQLARPYFVTYALRISHPLRPRRGSLLRRPAREGWTAPCRDKDEPSRSGLHSGDGMVHDRLCHLEAQVAAWAEPWVRLLALLELAVPRQCPVEAGARGVEEGRPLEDCRITIGQTEGVLSEKAFGYFQSHPRRPHFHLHICLDHGCGAGHGRVEAGGLFDVVGGVGPVRSHHFGT